jgi:hypothetical protein
VTTVGVQGTRAAGRVSSGQTPVAGPRLNRLAVLVVHMEWGLFVLAVLLVAALQFAVWRRLKGGNLGTPDSPGRSEAAPPADLAQREGSDDPDVQLCPSCGAQNDDDYRFCWDCTSMLQP